MEVKDVAVTKGTTHLVSKEDFCRIVNFKEPDDIENPYYHYEIRYVVATRGGKDLVCTRYFQSNGSEGVGGFVNLLQSCTGVKIVQSPEKKVKILLPNEIIPRLVGSDGKILVN